MAEENKNSLKQNYQAIEKLGDFIREQNQLLKESTEAKKRHFARIEEIEKKKLEIKKKRLDIERFKMQNIKDRNTKKCLLKFFFMK